MFPLLPILLGSLELEEGLLFFKAITNGNKIATRITFKKLQRKTLLNFQPFSFFASVFTFQGQFTDLESDNGSRFSPADS